MNIVGNRTDKIYRSHLYLLDAMVSQKAYDKLLRT
jgi:hypothetical protein